METGRFQSGLIGELQTKETLKVVLWPTHTHACVNTPPNTHTYHMHMHAHIKIQMKKLITQMLQFLARICSLPPFSSTSGVEPGDASSRLAGDPEAVGAQSRAENSTLGQDAKFRRQRLADRISSLPQDPELAQGELRAEPTRGKTKTVNHHAVCCSHMVTPFAAPILQMRRWRLRAESD